MTREVCEHFNPVDQPCAKCEEKRKSEALFLADELEIPLGTVIQSEVCRRAAKELRRLHAELERCKQVCAATSESWRTDAEKWKAQRDALLEALEDFGMKHYENTGEVLHRDVYESLKSALAEEALQRLTDVSQEIEAALAKPVAPVAWMHVPYPGNGMSPLVSLSQQREPSMYAASVPLYLKEQL